MGIYSNIAIDKFPKQGPFLNKKVMVCFHYDSSQQLHGLVVRDDAEEPGKMIIALEDGRYVMSTECSFRPVE